ncbi:alpha/beta fold hydrolase [Streptomyces caniscabiei]|uniref:Alpha/beta hydrolase n=1 Tax=Streptomyces caniscabiei TaxID=2746961 RepID=A0ABU4MGI2_9ACTN|nr:alpha/beta hydrolase [Streptomyces caniscabiei]MBE4734876.1 alpha/beta fold hydrolase [Streptomyces caniscabiei]MBE4754010.1 alpha/beta fold hydrolase [Streptomyces caniscabiei]MBE4767603.1 alpha/beta fold hydrolase [Streptomyces caniscabiei]MBE4784061.1 alpha/beta fold hydrolase [Streptomyces caniscabiei]MBE4791440.1 alpha/beta fold hydrolase [Streptomyces caniscabiei]
MTTFLAYEDKGEPEGLLGEAGPAGRPARLPLVLVHGHPFDRTMWHPQITEFSPTRRVVAPDLRGYGRSPVVPGVTPLSTFAEDIAALLDGLGVPEFVLGGLSMGGQIAMECYRLFPHRVRGLLLADTFPAAETEEGKRTRNAMADRLLREGMAGYADEVLFKMVAPYADPEVAARVRRMMTDTDPEGAAAALRGRAERPDYRELLTRVTVPALVVVGADDEYTPVSDAEAMHAALPDSALHIVDGAAHLPNLERPEEFNKALGAFLTRLD